MQAPVILGIDVARGELVVAREGSTGAVQHVRNDADSIRRWLETLAPGSVVAMESSGRYHRLLADLAHAKGMCVYVLNAHDVHQYARVGTPRAKTDRLDAIVIAHYVREHRTSLRRWQPPAGVSEALRRLLDQRAMLTRQLVAVRQSLGRSADAGEVARTLERAYTQAFELIDQQLRTLVRSEPALQAGVQRLETITGFGMQAAVRLAALFTRIDFTNANAVVAYSGLDPHPNDSGDHHGRRRLTKRGPPALRRQLYLVAFAACHSKVFGPAYRGLRERGFASTEALVILARKLLRLAWAIWKSGKPFDPSRVRLPACVET